MSNDGTHLTPREITSRLDEYIVGQAKAKRAVAVALRNRWRRRQLPAALAADVYPKNILLIGPTGVGKTEIARRLASLARAPFVRSRPPSTARSVTTAATWSRWCATSSRPPWRWCAPSR